MASPLGGFMRPALTGRAMREDIANGHVLPYYVGDRGIDVTLAIYDVLETERGKLKL